MTAYAVLAFLASGNIAQATSPVRWLIESRNSNGGYYSTQVCCICVRCGNKMLAS